MSGILRAKNANKDDIGRIGEDDAKKYAGSDFIPIDGADYYFVRIPHRHFDAYKIYAVRGDIPQILVWNGDDSSWFPVVLYQRGRRFLESLLLGRVLNDE